MQQHYDVPGVLINELLDDDEDELIINEFSMMNQTMKALTTEICAAQHMNAQKAPDFIGAQPISLMRPHFIEIVKNQDDWLVCEKTDGVRYIMIILSNGHVYLTGRNSGGGLQSANRSYQYYRINLALPKLFYSARPEVIEIFDGELIIDEFVDSKERKIEFAHYLIFDTLLHNAEQKVYTSNQTQAVPYYQRLRCAEEFLAFIASLKKLDKTPIPPDSIASKYFSPKNPYFPKIKPFLKDFFVVKQLNYLFNHYIPTLHHKNDGVIFTQNSAFYRPGTCEAIRKWKPPHFNTIDFLIVPNKAIEISNQSEGLLELYVLDRSDTGIQLIFFDFIYTTAAAVKEIRAKMEELEEKSTDFQAVLGVIAECGLTRSPNETKLKNLCQPRMFGCENNQLEIYFTELLKCTYHFNKTHFLENEHYKQHQLNIISSVQIFNFIEKREWIHLKDNFKSSWEIHRYRTDKTTPNHFRVALNVLQCLNENLTSSDLLEMLAKPK